MKNKEIALKDLFMLIIPKLWIVFLISAICAVGTFLYTSLIKDESYTSSSKLYIYSKNSDEANTSGVDAAKGMVEVYKIMLESDKFLSPVVSNLSQYEGLTTAHIRSMINITQVNETEIFSISITSNNAEMAYDLLWEIVENVPAGIERLIPNALNVTLLEDPALPSVANPKNEIRNAVLTFFVAAIISVLCIWVISMFDVKIRDKKKIEDNIDIPVLGVIPRQEIGFDNSNGEVSRNV